MQKLHQFHEYLQVCRFVEIIEFVVETTILVERQKIDILN